MHLEWLPLLNYKNNGMSPFLAGSHSVQKGSSRLLFVNPMALGSISG